MVDTSMVGQDVGSPAQNPVPQTPRYQQDPFSGEQLAQVSYGGGRAETKAGVGFKRAKPKWQQDPFTSDFDPNNINRPKFTTDEDWLENEEYAQKYTEQYDSNTGGVYVPETADATRLEQFKESGEITQENIADIYSLKEDELADYGIDIHAQNIGEAPEGITSGWNDEDGDGFDDDGHAYGTHGPVNVQTAQGEASIEALLADPGQGLTEPSLLDKGIGYAEGWAQPKEKLTSWGDTMTTSPGGAIGLALPGPMGAIAGIGGAISKANLENIYSKHGTYDANTGIGLMPAGTIPGVNTPMAVSPGIFSGTTVVSGATDLVPPQYDLNNDGSIDANELQSANDPNGPGQQAYKQWKDNKDAADNSAQEQTGFAHATAVTDKYGNAVTNANTGEAVISIPSQYKDQYAVHKAEQAAKKKAEAAAKKAAEEKKKKAAAAAAAAAQKQKEDNNPPPVAVTSGHYSQKNVDDQVMGTGAYSGGGGGSQSGVSYGSGHDWSAPKQKEDSGGGGGGDSCFAKGTTFRMADGSLKAIEEIKVGDLMEKGGKVYGILQGDGTVCDWYRYGDSYVTGSHFVKERGKWMPVWKSKKAEALLFSGFDVWYCVLNTKHLMVAGDKVNFTDFDAVDSVNEELEERLNERN